MLPGRSGAVTRWRRDLHGDCDGDGDGDVMVMMIKVMVMVVMG